MKRRLAAILAADIVGYSVLMAEDEVGTLEALRQLRRKLIHPAVAGHRGKVVKAMGDGWLVEFGSVGDAVNCSLKIQIGLERDPVIRLRIGVHLGDITTEDEDIYGDGVNVAARLEAICEPGGVVISDAVHGSLDGTLTPSFDDGGEPALKNIARPIRVWVRRASAPVADLPTDPGPVASSDTALITVTPVITSDDRDEVRELAAALTNDLTDLMGTASWLKATAAETIVPGSYVLSPVLRARGERLRLEAMLYAPDGSKIWSHRTDGDLADAFDWQDEAASDFATGCYAVLLDAERLRVAAIPEDEMDAETSLLTARLEVAGSGSSKPDVAIRLIAQAIERRPDYAGAYAMGAGVVHMIALSLGESLPYSRYAETFTEWVRRADNLLDRTDPARIPVALALHAKTPDPEGLRQQIRITARKHPFNINLLTWGALGYCHLGDPRAVLDFAERALRLVRDTPEAFGPLMISSRAHTMLGNEQKALDLAREAVKHKATFPSCHAAVASALAHLGRTDEARAVVETIHQLAPRMTVTSIQRDNGYVDNAATRRYFDGLRLAGLPEGQS